MSCVCHAFASVQCCLVVIWRERADLLAVCDVYCYFVTFPFGILGQVWYLIVSIPDPCCLSYFFYFRNSTLKEVKDKKEDKFLTLQAILWGHNLPNPSGGEIFLNKVTTSKCLILPLASGSYSDHNLTNSSRWWGPRMDQSLVR